MDSGVGGLTILNELRKLLPHEDFIFIADQAHVPYGERTLEEVQRLVEGIVSALLAGDFANANPEPMKLMVIACNTASAAALHPMRDQFPSLKFVGLEPAVKPAAENTRSQKIGVIATKATFQGKLYASLISRFATDLDVYTRACPEFVELVERGGPYTEEDQALVCQILAPLVEQGIDQLVLGCTHFPFLTPLLRECVGEEVKIIDPSPAVAKQTQRVLRRMDALSERHKPGTVVYVTTGDSEHFEQQVQTLTGDANPTIHKAQWVNSYLVIT
jgi:glutamate racemase